MKTFKDLKFKDHPIMPGLMARIQFDNGYGVSVVRFKKSYTLSPFDYFSVVISKKIDDPNGSPLYGSYTDNENEWELAILKNNEVCYDTPITEDVIGHLLEEDVTKIMKQIQELPCIK